MFVHQNIRRLQVTMDDAARVRVMDSVGYAVNYGRSFTRLKWSTGNNGTKILAVRIGHREVVLPLVLAYLVNGDDSRVVELSRRLGLDLKSSDHRWFQCLSGGSGSGA